MAVPTIEVQARTQFGILARRAVFSDSNDATLASKAITKSFKTEYVV